MRKYILVRDRFPLIAGMLLALLVAWTVSRTACIDSSPKCFGKSDSVETANPVWCRNLAQDGPSQLAIPFHRKALYLRSSSFDGELLGIERPRQAEEIENKMKQTKKEKKSQLQESNSGLPPLTESTPYVRYLQAR